MSNNLYQFSALSLQNKEISMKKYEGKVILIINTASECGFTPQFEGLEKLYKKYKAEGLEILGFPCNQFGRQEPGTEKEIADGCVINYGVTFQMFSKINVNGKEEHPIFSFLKNNLTGVLGNKIKWNFTKFLVDRKGIPVARFAPNIKPESLENDVIRLLSEN